MNRSSLHNLTDEELIELYKTKGEKDAMSILFKRYYHLVLGVGIKYLKRTDLAQDMSMKLFEKLLQNINKYQIQLFKPWLYRVACNECLMEIRKNKSLTKSETDIRLLNMESEEEKHLQEEKELKLNKLEEVLEDLPAEQVLCIKLFYLEKKSYNEICESTGLDFMKVKSAIQNGKRNLKLKLEQIHIE